MVKSSDLLEYVVDREPAIFLIWEHVDQVNLETYKISHQSLLECHDGVGKNTVLRLSSNQLVFWKSGKGVDSII